MALCYDEYRSRRYFPSLDGMRALSILLVITVHLYYTNFSWKWLSGWSGVTIFFVLSGYLITMLSLREEDQSGNLDLRAFYIRRAFRIFPLYFLVLGFYCLLIFGAGFGGATDHDRFAGALPYYLLYVNEYAPSAPFYQSWSLGIEEKFYLVWPALAFLFLRKNNLSRITVASVLIVILLFLGILYPSARLFHYYPIAMGCLLALVLHIRKSFEALRIFGNRKFSALAWSLFVAIQLSLNNFTFLKYLYPLVVSLVLLNVIMAEPGWLKWKPVTLIGERSYGIYLVHILCLRAVKLVFPAGTMNLWVSICGLAAGVMLSYAAAELLSRTVEGPCIRIGKKLSGSLPKDGIYNTQAAVTSENN